VVPLKLLCGVTNLLGYWQGWNLITNQPGESRPVPLPSLRFDIPPARPLRSVGRGTLCKQPCLGHRVEGT